MLCGGVGAVLLGVWVQVGMFRGVQLECAQLHRSCGIVTCVKRSLGWHQKHGQVCQACVCMAVGACTVGSCPDVLSWCKLHSAYRQGLSGGACAAAAQWCTVAHSAQPPVGVQLAVWSACV